LAGRGFFFHAAQLVHQSPVGLKRPNGQSLICALRHIVKFDSDLLIRHSGLQPEEILTLHRLKVPALLRKTLHSTNPIESMFSTVRDCEDNLKRYRGSRMSQRWLGAVLLHCEQGFKRVKGYAAIKQVVAAIEAEQAEGRRLKSAA
jgi:hypothetical protein